MSYLVRPKACKYCEITQIKWNKELNRFEELDGTPHDRTRCEGIRKNVSAVGSAATTAATTVQPSQQQQQQTEAPSQKLETLTTQVARLSEVYGDLVEHLQALTSSNHKVFLIVDKVDQFLEQARITDAKIDKLLAAYTHSGINPTKEQELADVEARYDRDREDGSLYGEQ